MNNRLARSRTLLQFAAALLLLAACGVAQIPPAAPAVYSNAELAFRYTPPAGLFDLTQSDREWIAKRAEETHSSKTLNLCLSLRSGPDDATDAWHSIGIETFPRNAINAPTDREAILKMSGWVAGPGKPVGSPKDVQVGPFHFVMSSFEVHEGKLIKRAHVYSAIIKDQVVSVPFSANSTDVLSRIEASIKTFQAIKAK